MGNPVQCYYAARNLFSNLVGRFTQKKVSNILFTIFIG